MEEEFLSELGHDLREPLTSLSCALALLSERAGAGRDADEHEFLDICLRNCQQLEALVRDVFSFRRRRSPSSSPEPTSPSPRADSWSLPSQPGQASEQDVTGLWDFMESS